MKINDFVLSIKELFFEILGFFLPGIFLLILLVFLFFGSNGLTTINMKYIEFLIIILSYILGYIIYGARLLLTLIHETIEISNFYEKQRKSTYVIKTEEIIKRNYDIFFDTDNKSNKRHILDLRNFAMSCTNCDRKIYTFIFRSDLCKHISTSLMIVNAIIIFDLVLLILLNSSFLEITIKTHIIFLICSIFPIFALEKAHLRFYKIGISIVFPQFISNENKKQVL